MDAAEKVSAGLVHLVDEDDARNLVAVSLTPHGFGLRFNASVAVQQNDSAIKNGQRTFNFDGEVNVARGVDDVETELVFRSMRQTRINCALPESGGRSRDRDPALLPCSIQSIVAAPSWTSPILWDLPV